MPLREEFVDAYMLAEVEEPPSVFNAKIEETEDGGFTIGYYPEKKDE